MTHSEAAAAAALLRPLLLLLLLWRAVVETVERARGAFVKAVARSRQPAITTRCATGSWPRARVRARQATHADGSADPAAHRHLRVPTPLPIAIERRSGCHGREILRRDVEPASKLTCSLRYARRPDAPSCSRPSSAAAAAMCATSCAARSGRRARARPKRAAHAAGYRSDCSNKVVFIFCRSRTRLIEVLYLLLYLLVLVIGGEGAAVRRHRRGRRRRLHSLRLGRSALWLRGRGGLPVAGKALECAQRVLVGHLVGHELVHKLRFGDELSSFVCGALGTSSFVGGAMAMGQAGEFFL